MLKPFHKFLYFSAKELEAMLKAYLGVYLAVVVLVFIAKIG